MNIAYAQLNHTVTTGALARAWRWLCLPLLLTAVVSAGHQSRTSDNQAALSQFIVDISVINHAAGVAGGDNPDDGALAAILTVVTAIPAFELPPAAIRAAVARTQLAFAPRAPPTSLRIFS